MLLVVPLLLAGQGYWLTVLTTAALLAFGSLGVWLTFSIGRINIAQGAFALIGGYVVAILGTRYNVSFWLSLPLAVLVAMAVATLVGWPILRLRGVYFAMITLSLTEVVPPALLRFPARRCFPHRFRSISPPRFCCSSASSSPGASPPRPPAPSSAHSARARSSPPRSASTSRTTGCSPSSSHPVWAAPPVRCSPRSSRTSSPPVTQ